MIDFEIQESSAKDFIEASRKGDRNSMMSIVSDYIDLSKNKVLDITMLCDFIRIATEIASRVELRIELGSTTEDAIALESFPGKHDMKLVN